MARPMRRQLASFSSKESTLLMTRRWSLAPPFATRFLRMSEGSFARLPQRVFQQPGERSALLRREKGADFQALAVTPQRQLTPMVGRLGHFHPHPIGIEMDFIARAARLAARNAQQRARQRHMLFASGSDQAGAKGP